MPESSTDSDLLSEDYLKLLHGLTREKVDENMIRCPHQETADAMEEVSLYLSFLVKPKTLTRILFFSNSIVANHGSQG